MVIVGSILLAFGLQAWWEGTQERASEWELLGRVHDELTSSRVILSEAVDSHRAHMESQVGLMEFARSDDTDAPSTLGIMIIRTFLGGSSTHLETGALDGALGSGQLGIISNEELRSILAAWPSAMSEFTEDERGIRAFGDSARPVVVEQISFVGALGGGFGLGEPTPQEVREFASSSVAFVRSRVGKNLIMGRLQIEGTTIREGETLLSTMDNLIHLLAVELDRSGPR